MYVVVEKSGHVGEQDVFEDEDYLTAHKWMMREYCDHEIDTLHVRIAFDAPEGRTYEI